MNKQLQKIAEATKFDWLEDRTILLAQTGSFAYGTNVTSSDKDYRGICIPPARYYIGLESFNEYNSAGGKTFKNTADDIDISIVAINKFVHSALDGVPNQLELLFMKDYELLTEFGQELIDNRHLFLSKRLIKKFGGYANGQVQRLMDNNYKGKGRVDLQERLGFDSKFAYHAIRLLTTATEIFETGTFTTERPNKELLVDIRNGVYTFDEVINMTQKYNKEMKDACDNSFLPEEPDYNKVNTTLMNINMRALGML